MCYLQEERRMKDEAHNYWADGSYILGLSMVVQPSGVLPWSGLHSATLVGVEHQAAKKGE
jgi:hypothetical protein